MTKLPEDSESETSADPPSSLPAGPACFSQLRELELELEKIRSQASAARLDARAAELELRIQRLHAQGGPPAARRTDQQPSLDHAVKEQRPEPSLVCDSAPSFAAACKLPEIPRDRSPRPAGVFRPRPGPDARSEKNSKSDAVDNQGPVGLASWNDLRCLIGHPDTMNPNPITEAITPRPDADFPPAGERARPSTSKQPARSKSSTRSKPAPVRTDPPHARSDKLVDANEAIELTTGPEEAAEKRRKPIAWLMSLVVHGMILVFLAAFTLSRTQPGDQVAIAGAVADTDELAIESLQIETAEMPETASEPVRSDVEYEISDIGEIPISDLINDAPPSPPSPMLDSMIDRDAINAASLSMKSDSDAKTKFCGVEGGGNHFVYLVDSSASMGSAFESARNALLESISVLKPNQRFYVIFFDAESDYMRLSSVDQDEPRSAFATPENKAALLRWAMKISMDRGRAPYDAIPFALELRPDVIFLLSDGEFPQRIEDLLRDTNRIGNLFGDEGPISIVHTIGYHSREGETRMQRIAKQNGGQYRYVPKP